MPPRTKYTPETVKRITDAIKLGATYKLASAYGGITFQTFNLWREQKPAFAARIAEAEGKAAVKWLAKIEQAASDGNWQAAAWKLERRYPQDYGRTVQEHQGKDGGPIAHALDLSALSDEQIDRLADLTERKLVSQ